MKAINPSNMEILNTYKTHSDQQVSQILDQVSTSATQWRTVPISSRAILMHKVASILREERSDLGRLITLEMGKPITESIAEVEKCAWVCEYYADHAASFLQDEFFESDGSQAFASFEPLGTVLAVMPWNFPFWQVFRFAAPGLMAGNAAVLKHASNVPGCALKIEELFQKAGFPENLFRTLLIPSSAVEAVISDDRVHAVTLTGSEWAGASVAAAAGKAIKKTVLELGGSDPYIVLEDADLVACAATAVTARMMNGGQSCIAAKRFLVVESVFDAFVERVKSLIENLCVADPLLESTQMGPLARPDLRDELHELVQGSVTMGARCLVGGRSVPHTACYYEPTLMVDVTRDMPVFQKETFGPVMPVFKVKNEEEAIRLANESEFGLGGSVWTRDLERGIRVARQVQSGAMFVNGMTKSDPRLPFGGIGKSGYGRELSYYGIKEFVNIKTIWVGASQP